MATEYIVVGDGHSVNIVLVLIRRSSCQGLYYMHDWRTGYWLVIRSIWVIKHVWSMETGTVKSTREFRCSKDALHIYIYNKCPNDELYLYRTMDIALALQWPHPSLLLYPLFWNLEHFRHGETTVTCTREGRVGSTTHLSVASEAWSLNTCASASDLSARGSMHTVRSPL
jgi:hypothetical protein